MAKQQDTVLTIDGLPDYLKLSKWTLCGKRGRSNVCPLADGIVIYFDLRNCLMKSMLRWNEA